MNLDDSLRAVSAYERAKAVENVLLGPDFPQKTPVTKSMLIDLIPDKDAGKLLDQGLVRHMIANLTRIAIRRDTETPTEYPVGDDGKAVIILDPGTQRLPLGFNLVGAANKVQIKQIDGVHGRHGSMKADAKFVELIEIADKVTQARVLLNTAFGPIEVKGQIKPDNQIVWTHQIYMRPNTFLGLGGGLSDEELYELGEGNLPSWAQAV
jgi:hypothetical protein